MTLYPALTIKITILASYIVSIIYIHFRGQVRLSALKQLTDHSSLMAPINAIMYFFSAVPKAPYLNVTDFPELQLMRDHWQIIRDEAHLLYQNGYISASERYDDIGFNSFFRRGWKRFYLKWYQKPLHSAENLCPKTVALIEKIPTINAAMFTLLPKDSFLFPHRDPYAGSLRYHLGLITPNSNDCYISVDGSTYAWKNGEDVVFDETYVHYAKNNTTEDRIILFCDIQRPLTRRWASRLNQLVSRTVMKAAASKNLPTEQVGPINQAFQYLYQLRLLGKRLKSYHKPLYYVTKYTIYIGLLCFFFLL